MIGPPEVGTREASDGMSGLILCPSDGATPVRVVVAAPDDGEEVYGPPPSRAVHRCCVVVLLLRCGWLVQEGDERLRVGCHGTESADRGAGE